MGYPEALLDNMQAEFPNVIRGLEGLLINTIASGEAFDDDIQEYLNHGVGRRLRLTN